MKTILVAGSAGFIGLNLCQYLLQKGFKVIGLDNFITGREENIETLKEYENFIFFKHDIIKPFMYDESIDYIINLASPASPIDYLKIPLITLEVNSIGQKNLLDLALHKKSRILIASTSEIYGDPLVHPQTEKYFGNVNLNGPRSIYDESKRFMETITTAYGNFYSLEVRIARIFNTYGPGMRLNDGRVLPAFIGQCLRGEKLTIFGDGKQTRSFCFIDDLIEGLYRLLMSNYKGPVNLGNPNEISILEFAQEICTQLEVKNNFIFKELPQDDPQRRKPDISLAKTMLNWEPKITREEGIKRTIDWFKSQPKEFLNETEPRKFENFN